MANKLKTMSVSCGRIRGLIRNKTVSLYVDTPQGHRSVCVEHGEMGDLFSVISTLHDSLADSSKKDRLKKVVGPSDSMVELDEDIAGAEEVPTP